jgi:hypothetical protein
MKLRTTNLLLTHLDDEMAWRVKEMAALRSAVRTAAGTDRETYIRAGVAMLYAHWEGFVKGAANAYVAYLAHRADRNRDLKPCFVALGMKGALEKAGDSSKSAASVLAVSNLLAELDNPVKLPKSDALSAQSNLSSAVFVNITGWIGIDPTMYSTRFNLIDETLLQTRNGIAHGQYLAIDKGRFESLADDVLELLRWFKTDIENAAVTKAYLRSP